MDLKEIREELKSKDVKIREKAVEKLAFAQDPATIPDLWKILERERAGTVRRRAVLALGRIGSEASADILYKTILKDKDEETRKNAAIALGNLGDVRAIIPLYHFYQVPRKNTFTDNLDRARITKVLLDLSQKKGYGSLEKLIEWCKNQTK